MLLIFFSEFPDAAEIYWQQFYAYCVDSEKECLIFDLTHLVPASGKLVLQNELRKEQFFVTETLT